MFPEVNKLTRLSALRQIFVDAEQTALVKVELHNFEFKKAYFLRGQRREHICFPNQDFEPGAHFLRFQVRISSQDFEQRTYLSLRLDKLGR